MAFLHSLTTSAAALAFLAACQSAPDAPVVQMTRIEHTQETIAACVAVSCARLNIDSGDLPDFAVIADLSHVTALRASWTDFDDLNDITAMTQLTELHLSSTQLTDLTGLSAFPNLDILHLQWNREVDDFLPIGGLTTLTELALGGNDVGDMPYVAELTNLDGLSLTSATVSSLTALIGHPTLTRLDLEMTKLPEDISALLTIPNLAVVSLTPSRLTDRQMVVVKELRAKGVQVDEIPEVVVVIC